MATDRLNERPLRSDAQRNRLRILSAAREVFARRGLDASLDEIADAAGVGVGTVYRRFPDKDALIDALFEERIGEITAAARRASESSDPWEALVWFLREACALQARDRGLKQALFTRGRERVEQARETILPLVTELVARAKESGALRPDLDPVDLAVLQLMVSAIADTTRQIAPQHWERMLQIIIDGLRTSREAPTPLPVAPLDRDQLATAISRRGCP